MNDIPHTTIYYVDSKTAKLKPKQLADKITCLVKDGKISKNDSFIKYIEIVKSNDGLTPANDWNPGEMCIFMFSEKKLNETISIDLLLRILENDTECREDERIGLITTEGITEKEIKDNACVILLDV